MQNSVKNLPLTICPACQGTWFREVTLNEFADRQVPYQPVQIDSMPMVILICLCGTPLSWSVGGIRGGRTPNYEISRFFRDLEGVERYLNACHDSKALVKGIAPDLFRRDCLEGIRRDAAVMERQVGRFLAAADRRDNRGRHWCAPRRNRATNGKGRDWLALEVQKCGFTFDQARAIVAAIFDAITSGLRLGEAVETPLGTFRVQEKKPTYFRVRWGKLQKMNRLRRVVVLEPCKP